MSRILGLDVSTKTIGISLFEDFGDNGKLQLKLIGW
jgi:RNase H-fold protein (predicted Holliday junction resolvase)